MTTLTTFVADVPATGLMNGPRFVALGLMILLLAFIGWKAKRR